MNTKTALITGASRGIGRATAEAFAKGGYNVIINYNKSEEQALLLERLINENTGVAAMAVQADVSCEAQVDDMFGAALSRFPAIDVLVNNAGVSRQALLTDTTFAQWEEIFAVNMSGAFLCSRAVLPGMISQKCGRIINISSIWGITGASCEAAYSASKAALIGFTKALAKEVGPSGITVNCVAPGVIETDMNAGFSKDDIAALIDQTPLLRLGSPAEVASAALYLSSDEAGFITGQVLSLNGGFVI